jgi:hypothetical protein
MSPISSTRKTTMFGLFSFCPVAFPLIEKITRKIKTEVRRVRTFFLKFISKYFIGCCGIYIPKIIIDLNSVMMCKNNKIKRCKVFVIQKEYV